MKIKQKSKQWAESRGAVLVGTPLTPAQHSRASERRALAAGAIRTPGGILPPDAAKALETLAAAGYSNSRTSIIARALIEASLRHNK